MHPCGPTEPGQPLPLQPPIRWRTRSSERRPNSNLIQPNERFPYGAPQVIKAPRPLSDFEDDPVEYAKRLKRRRIMQYTWVLVVLAYAGFRAFIVGKTMSGDAATGHGHGINTVHYFIIDATAAFIEAIATAKAIPALIDKKRRTAARWGLLAAAMFIVPDVYLITFGKNLTWHVYAIIGTVVTITSTITLISIIRKVKQAWSAGHHPHLPHHGHHGTASEGAPHDGDGEREHGDPVAAIASE